MNYVRVFYTSQRVNVGQQTQERADIGLELAACIRAPARVFKPYFLYGGPVDRLGQSEGPAVCRHPYFHREALHERL
jgi:hypothetical protein